MADSIVRLRIDSQEYDAKLKKAGDALNRYFDTVRKGEGTLENLDESVVEAVRAIGSMNTAATTAKGKIGEMTKVFTDLHVQYQQMTEAEKNSPLGKEMAQSLEQLKGRINETKGQLQQVNTELGNTSNESSKAGGMIESLTGKLGLNIKQLGGWGAAMAAGTAALKVAKDAFMANEETVDLWGQTVAASESLYNGFLNSLNNGDISGYLKNIDDIVTAAKRAYDAIDELETYNAFNQINIERTRTNMTESIADYREGSGSKSAVKAAGEAYKKQLEERRELEQKAYIDAIGKVAAERGVNKNDLQKALSGSYGSYKQLKETPLTGSQTVYYGGGMFGGGGTYQKAVPANNLERFGQALRGVTDPQIKSLQALGAQAQRTSTEIANVDKQLGRILNGSSSPGGSGGKSSGRGGRSTTPKTPKVEEVLPVGSVAALNKEIQELRKEQEKVTDITAWQNYQTQIDALTGKVKILKGQIADPNKIQQGGGASVLGLAIGQDELNNVESQLKAMLPKDGIKIPAKIEINTDGVTQQSKEMTKDWQSAANAIQSVGQAMQQIEDPTVRVAGTVAQAIATIALSYAEAMKIAAETTGPWGWIGFAGTGLATMLSTIAAIKSATKGYAEGGQFRGKSMSGDNNIIGINDGEVILNRAQQGNIASQLDGGREGAAYRPSYISGEQIYLALNRYTRRTGRGEIVTWR